MYVYIYIYIYSSGSRDGRLSFLRPAQSAPRAKCVHASLHAAVFPFDNSNNNK